MFPNKRKHYEIYFYICGCAYVASIASSPPLLLWSIFMREKAKPPGQKGSRGKSLWRIPIPEPFGLGVWWGRKERDAPKKIEERHTTKMEKNQLHLSRKKGNIPFFGDVWHVFGLLATFLMGNRVGSIFWNCTYEEWHEKRSFPSFHCSMRV